MAPIKIKGRYSSGMIFHKIIKVYTHMDRVPLKYQPCVIENGGIVLVERRFNPVRGGLLDYEIGLDEFKYISPAQLKERQIYFPSKLEIFWDKYIRRLEIPC